MRIVKQIKPILNRMVHGTSYICTRTQVTDINGNPSQTLSQGEIPAHKRDFYYILSDDNKARCQAALQKMRPSRKMTKLKQAAVLVPLCFVDGEPSVLFTRRSKNLKSHRGQVSFPGGKFDMEDQDLERTAVRETVEEIGLCEEDMDIWGALPPITNRLFNTAITPILANCGHIRLSDLQLNTNEVSYVFTRSLASFCDPKNTRYTHYSKPNVFLPVFLGGEDRIWGITAIILHRTMSLIADDVYRFKLDVNR